MALQTDPEKLWRLNWRESLPDWLRGSTAKSSANDSASTPGGLPAETVVKPSAGSPASPPTRSSANDSAEYSDGFPRLSFVRIGDTVRIAKPPEERFEWTNADFGRLFLLWIVCEYPACRKGWVNVNDIEDELYVRFIEAAGCHNLDLGALLRGLGQVTEKRDRSGKALTGKRCSIVEYWVPDPAAAERKRA